jgi:hypothetical protein
LFSAVRNCFYLICLTTLILGCVRFSEEDNTQFSVSKKILFAEEFNELDYCDVKNLLSKSCFVCHSEQGLAPFAFNSLDMFRIKKSTILHVLENGIMPPWKPDPAYQEFKHQYYLTDKELSMLYTWIYHGAKEGFDCKFEVPDVNILSYQKEGVCFQFTKGYKVPENYDHYSYFRVPNPFSEDVYLSYVDLIPCDGIAHHMSAFVIKEDSHTLYNSNLEWEQINSLSKMVSNWTMGSLPHRLKPGQAFFFPKSSQLLIQVHFTDGSKGLVDSSFVCFKKAELPVTQEVFYFYKDKMDIFFEPGVIKLDSVTVDITEDIQMLAIWPHTHRIATEVKCYAVLPDNTIMPLIKIPKWDYFWQNLYEFVEPKRIPKGSQIRMVVNFDNTNNNAMNPYQPPQRIEHGLRSKDEMLVIAYTYVLD